mmetsp:Transcript_47709/g.102200  ORF Transcript_47709/g.102200 Transcript_47709/m.102200 type:complete len:469 (+) Transcript_47709:446-1852(+)
MEKGSVTMLRTNSAASTGHRIVVSRPGSAGSISGPRGPSSATAASAAAVLTRKPSRDYYETIRKEPTNRSVLLKAVERDRYALLHADAALRADREVVLSAVKFCGDTLLLSPLKKDREVVLAAVNTLGDSLRYADQEWMGDKEVILTAVKQDGLALRYATAALQDDEEVVRAAVKQNGRALRWVADRWKKDLDTVMMALKSSNAALAYVATDEHETAYGLSADGTVLAQSLWHMELDSHWKTQGKGPMRSLTVFGPRIYGVSTDGKIYSQIMVTMTMESEWTGPLSGDNVQSIAIADGFIYAVKEEDKRVYKQVLVQMTPDNHWDGPISDPTEVESIAIYEDIIFATAPDGSLYKQNLFRMCNVSPWEGPQSNTIKVQSVAVFGAAIVKVYGVEMGTGKIYCHGLKDLHPVKPWHPVSAGDTSVITICNSNLKDACRDMLESQWRASGAHYERRAAASRIRGNADAIA